VDGGGGGGGDGEDVKPSEVASLANVEFMLPRFAASLLLSSLSSSAFVELFSISKLVPLLAIRWPVRGRKQKEEEKGRNEKKNLIKTTSGQQGRKKK
jgi:hypothetical protein